MIVVKKPFFPFGRMKEVPSLAIKKKGHRSTRLMEVCFPSLIFIVCRCCFLCALCGKLVFLEK